MLEIRKTLGETSDARKNHTATSQPRLHCKVQPDRSWSCVPCLPIHVLRHTTPLQSQWSARPCDDFHRQLHVIIRVNLSLRCKMHGSTHSGGHVCRLRTPVEQVYMYIPMGTGQLYRCRCCGNEGLNDRLQVGPPTPFPSSRQAGLQPVLMKLRQLIIHVYAPIQLLPPTTPLSAKERHTLRMPRLSHPKHTFGWRQGGVEVEARYSGSSTKAAATTTKSTGDHDSAHCGPGYMYCTVLKQQQLAAAYLL